MKTLTFFLSLVLIAAVQTGCSDTHGGEQAQPEPVPAASYKAGHGVRLTEAGKKFARLETIEATTRKSGGADVVAIPATALLRTVRGDFVYVANGEWFLRTPVTVGEASGEHLEIRDGLYEGDTIVSKGVRALSLSEIQALNGGVGCADGH